MSSTLEPLLEIKKAKIDKDKYFYVYFDEWDGEILEISSKQLEKKTHYLKTKDNIAEKMLIGSEDPSKYTVADTADGHVIIKKSDHVALKKAEEQLSLVPVIKGQTQQDINVIFYINDWKLEVNMNQDVVYRLTGRRYNKNLKTKVFDENYDKIQIYLIMKNNPTLFIECLEVDPIELMNEGYKIFDISHLRTTCSASELQVLTKRIFKSYGTKYKRYYTGADFNTRKGLRRYHAYIVDKNNKKYISASDKVEKYTFVISETDSGWSILSNFNDPVEYKIYRDLKLFITGEDPNELLYSVVIPWEKLGWHQEYNVDKMPYYAEDCRILVGDNIKNITFAHEELEYVKPGTYN